MRYAINGFGRIGRALFRILWERDIGECVFINDAFMDIDNMCYLLKHDSLYGAFDGKVYCENGHLIVSDESRKWSVKILNMETLNEFDRNKSNINLLIEASGNEGNFHSIKNLCETGYCKYGIITYAHEPVDFMLIYGVNEVNLDLKIHKLISTGICDVNAIAPVIKAVNDRFTIDSCFVTSLHPWLSYQNILDGPVRSHQYANEAYRYYHLGRMSTDALIPKTTTLGSVLQKALPEMKGKVVSYSYRVPTSTVCSADISVYLEQAVPRETMTDFLKMLESDVIAINSEKLISTDFKKNKASCIIDLNWVEVNKNMLKLILWYDNEWGYSCRVADTIKELTTYCESSKA